MKLPAVPAALARLSRDTRDTLFLLLAVAAIALPHAGHLPAWATAVVLLVLGWRAAVALRGDPLPSRPTLTLVLVACVGLTWLSHRSLINREAGITLVTMLLALKTLELRARRDAFVIFFLGFFLVLTHFLYSQSLLSALWMLGAVWALLTAVVLAQMPVGQPSLALAARHAARTTALGLPVMLLLFLLFPRIAPLWGIPSEAVGKTGLSNQLDFGGMSEIANDESIAMRLRFIGRDGPPPLKALYFRGPVLSRFDGRSWRPGLDAGLSRTLQVQGRPLRYELTMEPLRLRLLPLLEMSPQPVGSQLNLEGGTLTLRREGDLRWSAPRPITERLRLEAEAYPDYQAGIDEAAVVRRADLELPPGRNPRTLAWAGALRAEPRFAALDDGERPAALAAAVMRHIASADFTYTLSPGRYGELTPDVIDEFWFDRRLGFCEHFAAAFVVVMRAMGVPARVVTGFQGVDPLPQDGWWIVRNSNAHAWAEYWAPGRGWLRADPTAAVAPERVNLGRALRPAPGALEQLSPAVWGGLRSAWETLDNRWQQLVLNYSRQNQFELMKQLGVAQPDWVALGQISAGLIALLTLAGAGAAMWQARPHDAWTRLRGQLLRELHRLGVSEAAAHQGPGRWAALLMQRHGERAAPLAALLLSLERERYAGGTPPGRGARRRWLKSFRAAGRMLRRQSASDTLPDAVPS
ncbi:DUF3488 and transglutaminase-like domain-containing protein [Pelomonas sp. KK5]|uniref:DUF3488 and transglutaminase-like domain-containing protein n=1 Tax=Pelomonas sp. KK5 TaxID=1855730 RepID=UPI00097C3C08|nr:DUF3488 and transglutaminase-like domain-containing protein [Pelomonas sp. KK5]